MQARFVGFSVEGAPPEQLTHLGAARVVAWSVQPFGTNAHVRAWVGDQELTAVNIDQFGLSIEGFLAQDPAATDTFSVQIDGGEKVDTGLTAEDGLIS
jgi:hypothetical protein